MRYYVTEIIRLRTINGAGKTFGARRYHTNPNCYHLRHPHAGPIADVPPEWVAFYEFSRCSSC